MKQTSKEEHYYYSTKNRMRFTLNSHRNTVIIVLHFAEHAGGEVKKMMCIKHFISQQLNRKSNALLAVHFNKTFTFNRLHWTKAVHAKSETWPQLNIHASLSSCWWCHDIYSQHNWVISQLLPQEHVINAFGLKTQDLDPPETLV